MTLAGAMAAGALSNGGHLMAIYDDCVESNWKSSVDSIETKGYLGICFSIWVL